MLRILVVGVWLAFAPSVAAQAAPSPTVDAGGEPAPRAPAGPAAAAAPSRVDTLAVRARRLLEPQAFEAAVEPGVRTDSRSPFDLFVASRVRSPAIQQSGALRVVAGVLRSTALPGTLLLAGALYGSGQLVDSQEMSDLGLQTGQAIVVAGSLSVAGKVLVGRARPHESPDDPHDVRFGRGIRGERYQSFPSGHTAAAFATAAVLASELSEADSGRHLWLTPLLYAGAGLTGASRIFHDEHWATDILAGAVIGIASGLATVHYQQDRLR